MTRNMNFMTLNVRHDNYEHSEKTFFAAPPVKENPLDPKEFSGEQPWSIRKWKILDTILLYSPDVLGLQESVLHQIQDLEALLGKEYKWVGVGREDGDKQGEMTAVFYKVDVLAIESWKTIWLSEKPEEAASVGWDARHSRTATQKLKDDVKFTVFNVHLDHVGEKSREESSKLLLERAKQSEAPVFLLGDLNSTREETAYKILTGSHDQKETDTLANLQELNNACASTTGLPVRTAPNSMTLPTHRVVRPGSILENIKRQEQEAGYFKDARYVLRTRLNSKGAMGTLSGPYGYRNTLTSFNTNDEDSSRAPLCIDFILVLAGSHSQQMQVNSYAVIPNEFDDGLYLSDHRPVLAKVSWQ